MTEHIDETSWILYQSCITKAQPVSGYLPLAGVVGQVFTLLLERHFPWVHDDGQIACLDIGWVHLQDNIITITDTAARKSTEMASPRLAELLTPLLMLCIVEVIAYYYWKALETSNTLIEFLNRAVCVELLWFGCEVNRAVPTRFTLQKMTRRRTQKKMAMTPVPMRITISTLVLSSEPEKQNKLLTAYESSHLLNDFLMTCMLKSQWAKVRFFSW